MLLFHPRKISTKEAVNLIFNVSDKPISIFFYLSITYADNYIQNCEDIEHFTTNQPIKTKTHSDWMKDEEMNPWVA